jgi:repressor of nif and glnA expression
MDEQTLIAMLKSIRKNNMLGPKIGDHEIGARITYALDKGLIKRFTNANFAITEKGIDLLEGRLSWENL